MKHVDIRIHGKVQGVLFRATAQKEAERLDITGFARNEPDGTVYIEAEGDDQALDEFIDWCREGSGPADVRDIGVEPGKLKDYKEFTTF